MTDISNLIAGILVLTGLFSILYTVLHISFRTRKLKL